ncbi:MAG: AMP-binding protein [Burkholderiales bacterium]
MSEVLAAVDAVARAAPSRIAVCDGAAVSITYAALAADIRRCAQWLAQSACGRVAIALVNGPSWVILDLAATYAGCPVVPLPLFFSVAQGRHVLTASGADCLLTDAVGAGRAAELGLARAATTSLQVSGAEIFAFRLTPADAVRLPPGTAKITFTSGTTGTPKGVCLSQVSMETVARSLASAVELKAGDRHASILPLSTLLENIAGVYAQLLAGATCCVPPPAWVGVEGSSGLDAGRMLAALGEARATTTVMIPAMLQAAVRALESGAPVPAHLRFVAVGGARVAPALLAQAHRLGLPAYEGYGLSECASVVALNTPQANRPGSVGRVLPHARLTLAADGEILVAGAGLLGYAGTATMPAKPWPSGDVGWIDADGYLHLSGRKNSLFITAFGRNVSPEWVEAELCAMPAIAQAAVFGEAKPWNAAVIVPRGAADDATIGGAVAAVNAALPDYARVTRWVRAPAPFSLQSGELTENGRLRRAQVQARHRASLDFLYAENTMPFYDRLLATTGQARAALLRIPFLVDGAAGRLAREDYVRFLGQAYHHVKHTLPLLMACGARLPDRLEWLRAALTDYIKEETGHQEWILDDIRVCGGDAERVRSGRPDLAADVLVAYAYDLIARRNPVGFLGMVLVLEGTSTQVASAGHGARSAAGGVHVSQFARRARRRAHPFLRDAGEQAGRSRRPGMPD